MEASTNTSREKGLSWYRLTADQVLETQKVDMSLGLNEAAVTERHAEYGLNEVTAQKNATILQLLWEQINSVLIYILLIGAILSFGFSNFVEGIVILIVVIIDVFLGFYMEVRANQTNEALKSMMSPTATVQRDGERHEVPAKNLVPGDIVFLQSGDIVPLDGRLIACFDFSVSESALTGESHAVNKSLDPITSADGEEEENVPLAEQSCMVFAGTHVQKGSGMLVATSIGSSTEVGKIGSMLASVKPLKTPLVIQLEIFARYLSIAILVLAFLGIGVALGRGYEVVHAFEIGIGIAIAAIPEGLPSIVTITFSIAVRYLAKRGAVLKSLPAVETLGSVSVICSDKTGTLTMNQMTVKRIVTGDQTIILDDDNRPSITKPMVAEHKADELQNPMLQYLLPGILCNNADIKVQTVTANDSLVTINELEAGTSSTLLAEAFKVLGDPTESCILSITAHLLSTPSTTGISTAASTNGGRIVQLARRNCPRISEIPFNSEKKYMATLHFLTLDQVQRWLPGNLPVEDQYVIFTKGAPEQVIALTTPPTGVSLAAHQDYWKQQANDLAKLGMRTLGLAYRNLGSLNTAGSPGDLLTEELVAAGEFTMTCLLGIIDPPRPEAILAVKEAQNAGITVKMITGDHPMTAATIGKMIGLHHNPGRHTHHAKEQADAKLDIEEGKELEQKGSQEEEDDSDNALTAITGNQLDEALSHPTTDTFDKLVHKHDIFARTTPSHKLQIVQSLQQQGCICSMTGDGVNDAPALKAANIGVAMGITGTDVAKDAAQMILTDDNFATIVQAVKIGRTTYHNLVKVLAFVLPTNGAQAFSVLMALVIGITVPITALQILWINLVTSITLGIVLAFEKPHEEIMSLPPRRANKAVFGRFLWWRLAFVTVILVSAVLGNFQWEKQAHPGYSIARLQATAVNTLAVGQVAYLFSCRNLRTTKGPYSVFIKDAQYVWLGVIIVAGLQATFTYAPPFQYLFGTEGIDGEAWAKAIFFGVITFVVVEVEKIVARATAPWRLACFDRLHWTKLPRHYHDDDRESEEDEERKEEEVEAIESFALADNNDYDVDSIKENLARHRREVQMHRLVDEHKGEHRESGKQQHQQHVHAPPLSRSRSDESAYIPYEEL